MFLSVSIYVSNYIHLYLYISLYIYIHIYLVTACQMSISGDPSKAQVVPRTIQLSEGVVGEVSRSRSWKEKAKTVHFFAVLGQKKWNLETENFFELWKREYLCQALKTLQEIFFLNQNWNFEDVCPGKNSLDSENICTTLNDQLNSKSCPSEKIDLGQTRTLKKMTSKFHKHLLRRASDSQKQVWASYLS